MDDDGRSPYLADMEKREREERERQAQREERDAERETDELVLPFPMAKG